MELIAHFFKQSGKVLDIVCADGHFLYLMKKRGWHNPSKALETAKEGYCNLCHKEVKSLEAHKKTKHMRSK